ncbi:MAG: response regulator [Candidatus Muiribacteriota bacterium]|jgi:two-component system chemotaxis response regulator CheY
MGYSVLLVDDSKTQRAIIKKILGMACVEVDNIYEAENGKVALEVLSKEKIDIVFTDLNMPVMTGEEMVEKISEIDSLKKIPVVIVTSKGSDVLKNEFEKKGVKFFLTKPFTPEDICDIINELLGE